MTGNEETAPYEITYEDRGAYLYAHVDGQFDTVATSLRYWSDVAAECRKRGHRRMLVVEDFQTEASTSDVFQVAERLPAITRGLKVAFVDERFAELSTNKFGEDVAVNRGAQGRVFADAASADEWLRHS
jgi:hypothetical protein